MDVILRVTLLLVSVLAAACGPGGVEPDAGGGPDGTDLPSGLVVHWSASGLGEAEGPVVIDRLELALRDLRVIGDAAPEATYLAAQDIELRDDEATPITAFPDAPPGRYSAFELSIDRPGDGDDAWSLGGEVEIDGTVYPLEIEDATTSSISLPFDPDLTLAAGQTGVITLEVDVASLVEGIDWSDMAPEDGEDQVSIEEDSPVLAGMRQRLRAAIRVAGIDVE